MNNSSIFELVGSKEKAVLALLKMGIKDKEGAQKILDYLYIHSDILDESENFEVYNEHDNGEDMMNLTLFDSSLYINVKTITIVMVAFLLDVTLTGGIAALSLSLLGLNNKALASIKEENGEKCILKETLLHKPHIGNMNILDCYEKKCQNLNYQCKYREGESCNCSHDAIVNIYENLIEKNIFKRSADRLHYIYQW